jgi:hypothetical protein
MKLHSNLSLFKKIIFKTANPILNRILSLKNIHRGQSCYIIGDGVSIKWFDLSAFSDKPVISLNKIIFHKQSNLLNLKYILLIEPYYFYPYFYDPSVSSSIFKNDIQKKYREKIKKHKNITFFTNLSNYPVLWGPNIYYLFHQIKDKNNDFKFFEECNFSGLNIFNGSLRCSIALAIYMGFKEIFLVGCDYTHEKSMSRHWFTKGKGVLKPQPTYENIFFNIACKYVNIHTITSEGKGVILPSKTYTSFTGKKLVYKENYELMDNSMMNVLSKDPMYKGVF